MRVIAAVIRKGPSVLLVRKRGERRWTYPGGKIKGEETETEALLREIEEELGQEAKVERFGRSVEISGTGHPEDREITLICTEARITGKIYPSNEIEEVRFFSPQEFVVLVIKDEVTDATIRGWKALG